ncbi:Alpha/Beta hydrolase protein [Mucor mucedo]|uniref:Alpha/Beta hydrolase protein n=1 Tax=Mucor mucedo TaxID=29922 RepID=UPI00221F415A|nr:Alpha/Beta hydrolase protein [Mucor mucedo]KAI7896196.1 Alpha/Beta hydrolase protein [Mucor mucedo]
MSLLSAFVATCYIFSVLFFAAGTVCAFDLPIVRPLFNSKLRKYMIYCEILTSGITESSHHLIVLKLVIIQLVNFFGGFNYALSWIMYIVDIITMGALGMLFFEMLNEITVADTVVKAIDASSQPIKSIVCFEDFKKLINPIWTPENIKVHPNITYANNEEIRDALNTTNQDFDQPRKMMLDVYTSSKPSKSGLQPVLVHIHGGAWEFGSKNTFYPHEKLLVQENNWVIVNVGYRLVPKNAYPTHLMDIKRAIRWMKLNIASFGGDPNFIVLSGDSAGGHLAAMASMTTNEPQYQPGFEDVDTSVRGVITLSGALDVVTKAHHATFFSKHVAKLDKVDTVFLNQHSPLSLVEKARGENKLVPFLLIAGERDGLTECEMSKSFKEAYNQATGGLGCELFLLPAGHHVYYITWSPRSLYISRVIQAWCTQLYIKNK